MRTQRLSLDIVSAAIAGFEQKKNAIEKRISEIRATLAGETIESGSAQQGPKMSVAARKRIAAAQKARWAKFHVASLAPKPKRKLSAEMRAQLVANLRKARAAKAAKARAAAM